MTFLVLLLRRDVSKKCHVVKSNSLRGMNFMTKIQRMMKMSSKSTLCTQVAIFLCLFRQGFLRLFLCGS